MAGERLIIDAVEAGASKLETMMPGTEALLSEWLKHPSASSLEQGLTKIWSNGSDTAVHIAFNDPVPSVSMLSRQGLGQIQNLGIAFSDGSALTASKDTVQLVTRDGNKIVAGENFVSVDSENGRWLSLNFADDKFHVVSDGIRLSDFETSLSRVNSTVNIRFNGAFVDLPDLSLSLGLERGAGASISRQYDIVNGVLQPELHAGVSRLGSSIQIADHLSDYALANGSTSLRWTPLQGFKVQSPKIFDGLELRTEDFLHLAR